MVGRSRRGTFCTAALVANLRTGNLMAANAGHHPVLRISTDRVSTLLPASGPPLGILEGVDWSDEAARVKPGETLLLFTDGIVEARNGEVDPVGDRDIDEYGIERLEKVTRQNPDRSPRELIEAVLADVDRFCHAACSARRLHDDRLEVPRSCALRRHPRLQVSSDPRFLGVIRGVVQVWLEVCGLVADRRHEVVLAVDEACSNAIRHAYGGRTDESVELVLSASTGMDRRSR